MRFSDHLVNSNTLIVCSFPRPPPSSVATSNTGDHVPQSVVNVKITSGEDVKNVTDDWDGEDDYPETANILAARPNQQTFMEYPVGMVHFMNSQCLHSKICSINTFSRMLHFIMMDLVILAHMVSLILVNHNHLHLLIPNR